MSASTYPFPLPVNSSHHSLYHRFLLGAQKAALHPMPKPYCIGRMTEDFSGLSAALTLPKWQKLYNASFPWTEGHPPQSYDLRNVAPHRPLPAAFERPLRRFAAFDFVQMADPSVSALALIAGDSRVLDGFVKLSETFSLCLEKGIRTDPPRGSSSQSTGRGLIGHFVEPNNRWLMPCLHAHARLLNFTSRANSPLTLYPIDGVELATRGRTMRAQWLVAQRELLHGLGYQVDTIKDPSAGLIVSGCDQRLLAAIDAPKIAVIKVLERLLGQDSWRALSDVKVPGSQAILAAMADHLETMIQESIAYYKPQKFCLPLEGPWRQSVTTHLQDQCPLELTRLRQAARIAQAVSIFDELSCIIPAPMGDACHAHAAAAEAHDGAEQHPLDPDLALHFQNADPVTRPYLWLSRAFEEAYSSVRSEIISQRRPWIDAPRQRILRQWELTAEDYSLETLRRETRCLEQTVVAKGRELSDEALAATRANAPRPSARILEELVASLPDKGHVLSFAAERSRGGRSL